jgi:AcrR family transcriptional regulator
MARVQRQDRLVAVATAATAIFGRLGYRRTRTSDVAKDAGMSSGSLFNYVESKEALFHLVFLHGFGLLGSQVPELPLPTPAEGETASLIEDNLRKVGAPNLRAALTQDNPDDIAMELHGIIEERYLVQEQLWPLLAVIERCAIDLPSIEEFYYRRTRINYFGRLAQYLEQRSSAGYLRSMPDFAVTARLVSESISWFAWHRREGRDALLYDDDSVRKTVIQFICAALLES